MISFTETEVATYFRARVPALKQRGSQWRGRSPLRDGRRDSFSVDPATGRCCDFGGDFRGDVMTLEMALTRAGFAEARKNVFAIVGRPDSMLTRAERHRIATQAAADRRDQWFADLLRAGRVKEINARLIEEKSLFFDTTGELGDGEFIETLTRLESYLCGMSAADRLLNYRRSLSADPDGTQRLIAEAAEDEAHAKKCTTIVVRLLEMTERQQDRRVA